MRRGKSTARGMTHQQLIDALIEDLERLAEEVRWKSNMTDGGRSTSVTGNTPSGGGISDPTHRHATTGTPRHISNVLSAVHRDLTWLYQSKLPAMLGRLDLDEEHPHPSDPPRSGGMSTYRGDHKAPTRRPDLQQALDAQRRRNDRGESHGAG